MYLVISGTARYWGLCLGVFFLCACSQNMSPMDITPKMTHHETSSVSQQQKAWWTVRFILPWQKQEEPKWYIGTLIAGEIITPLLATFSPSISLWRFHRRAKDDNTGYAFSFMFYSTVETAEKIYTLINTSDSFKQLKEKGLVTQLVLDDLQANVKTKIEDTSDKEWPTPIRKTWPVYMMGVSQMWLDLISELQSEAQQAKSQEEKYQIIQDKITALWEKNGQHAWLHHLNAMYGYAPVAVRF